ncbi:MAG: DJ-1/PfpI family protein [Candidatus Omnitrophica bacterium]|nr:DJ-1/PfpI family protein [Candidatus Omnitrophota bacterium]
MVKKVLVILAEGFEEIEAITPVDVLRRAGVEVTLAGLSARTVSGAHGVKFQADVTLDEYRDLPDAIILPGGMPGAQNLAESKKVAELIKKMNAQKKVVGAICAAPALALAPTGILDGKRATCYPGFEKNFSSAITFSKDRVVRDGNIITSRGPGSALEFALELVEQLVGCEKAKKLSEAMLLKT